MKINKNLIQNFKIKNQKIKKYFSLSVKIGILFLIIFILSYFSNTKEGFQDNSSSLSNIVSELQNQLTVALGKVSSLVSENLNLKNIIKNITGNLSTSEVSSNIDIGVPEQESIKNELADAIRQKNELEQRINNLALGISQRSDDADENQALKIALARLRKLESEQAQKLAEENPTAELIRKAQEAREKAILAQQKADKAIKLAQEAQALEDAELRIINEKKKEEEARIQKDIEEAEQKLREQNLRDAQMRQLEIQEQEAIEKAEMDALNKIRLEKDRLRRLEIEKQEAERKERKRLEEKRELEREQESDRLEIQEQRKAARLKRERRMRENEIQLQEQELAIERAKKAEEDNIDYDSVEPELVLNDRDKRILLRSKKLSRRIRKLTVLYTRVKERYKFNPELCYDVSYLEANPDWEEENKTRCRLVKKQSDKSAKQLVSKNRKIFCDEMGGPKEKCNEKITLEFMNRCDKKFKEVEEVKRAIITYKVNGEQVPISLKKKIYTLNDWISNYYFADKPELSDGDRKFYCSRELSKDYFINEAKEEYSKLILSNKERDEPQSNYKNTDLEACGFSNNLFNSINSLKDEYTLFRNGPTKSDQCISRWAGRINEFSQNLYQEINNLANEITTLKSSNQKIKTYSQNEVLVDAALEALEGSLDASGNKTSGLDDMIDGYDGGKYSGQPTCIKIDNQVSIRSKQPSCKVGDANCDFRSQFTSDKCYNNIRTLYRNKKISRSEAIKKSRECRNNKGQSDKYDCPYFKIKGNLDIDRGDGKILKFGTTKTDGSEPGYCPNRNSICGQIAMDNAPQEFINYCNEVYNYYNRLEELLTLRKCLLNNNNVKNYIEILNRKDGLEKDYKILSELVSLINLDI